MLEWIKIHPDARGSRTKDGKYSVCAVGAVGTPEVLWEVWKLAPGGPWFALLEKNLPSEEAAQKRAQSDVSGERKRA